MRGATIIFLSAAAVYSVTAQGGVPHVPSDAWISLAQVGADGKCTDSADAAAWATHSKDFEADLAACGKKCWGAAACVSTCIAGKDGYSADCSGCFGALTGCTKDHCLGKCLGGNTPACAACVKKAGCDTEFTTCAGVAPPSSSNFVQLE